MDRGRAGDQQRKSSRDEERDRSLEAEPLGQRRQQKIRRLEGKQLPVGLIVFLQDRIGLDIVEDVSARQMVRDVAQRQDIEAENRDEGQREQRHIDAGDCLPAETTADTAVHKGFRATPGRYEAWPGSSSTTAIP